MPEAVRRDLAAVRTIGSAARINPESLGRDTDPDYRFKYIDISCVNRGRIDWNQVQEIRFRAAPSRARRVVRPADILVCTVRPGLQAHAFAGWDDADGHVCSTGFAVVRALGGIEPRFLWHVVFSEPVVAQLRRLEVGSNYPAVNESDIAGLSIPDIGLNGQRRIAEVLDALDEAIGETETLITKLQKIKAGVLHDLLTRGIDENGELRDPVADPHKFQSSPLGFLPRSWEVVRVEQAGSVQLGRQRSPKYQSGRYTTPYLRVANVFDGYIDYSDILSMDFTPVERITYGLKPDDILLNEGQSIELVGRSALYRGERDRYCFQNTLVRFRTHESNVPAFCEALFRSWLHTGCFRAVARQTTSVAHLGADRFARMWFPQPPSAEQQRIANALAMQEARILSESEVLRKLASIKSGLIHDLLTGKVRVPSREAAT